ncbi:MAG: beta-ketoacyl-ACP synthase [Symploca sp. SIO2E6]|nr:beta-ketoacyl-ACP synthase [Symploca sp. SIO2E6]
MSLNQIVVTGIGLVSALGGLKPSWQRLLAGESSIKIHQPFPDLSPRPLALINQTSSALEELTQLAVAEALQDAALEMPLPDCGVVIGSSRGCQASWEQLARGMGGWGDGEMGRWGDKGDLDTYQFLTSHSSFPNDKQQTTNNKQQTTNNKQQTTNLEHWLDLLPHQAAIATARQVGAIGPVLAPMAACATGIWAIAQGFELIQTGCCQRVIAGAVEAPVTRLTLAGFDKMGVLATTGAYPFDRHREGLVLGEGAAVLILESADLAFRRGVPVYGQILGFGLTSDAYHAITPNPDRESAIAAVKQCLERSHISPAEIDYIHAHGTSTQLNDQKEAELMQKLFPQGVPVSSTKGATGHTLGVSGALGAAFCLMALRHQLLPPCVGLQESDFDLDLVIKPRREEVQRVLNFSFGFGGQNTVMALGKI